MSAARRPFVLGIEVALFSVAASMTADVAAAVDVTGLVYTPIAPCRILDTRVTDTPFSAKETRAFATNSAATQGGGACTVYSDVTPTALSLNVTVDATGLGNPGSYGFLALAPQDQTSTSWMNFVGGQTIANAGVAAINPVDGTFSIKSQNPANVIVDVYGYWVPSPVQRGTGNQSVAMGDSTTASGPYSTVMGAYGTASGPFSTAMGEGTTASDFYSTAMGSGTNATSLASTAMGLYTTASGVASTAMGYRTTADGYTSVAMGFNASSSSHNRSFVFADGSLSDDASTENTTDFQFMVRASGGFVFYTSSNPADTAESTGVYLSANNGSWSTLSDRNAKDSVRLVDSRDVLERVVAMPLNTWRYKAQDPKYRHMGPMAQDFYAAFHLGESDTAIDTIDADGVALAAIQGLNAKLNANLVAKDKEIASLRVEKDAQIAALQARIASLESLASRVAALERTQTSNETPVATAPK